MYIGREGSWNKGSSGHLLRKVPEQGWPHLGYEQHGEAELHHAQNPKAPTQETLSNRLTVGASSWQLLGTAKEKEVPLRFLSAALLQSVHYGLRASV